jgi:hypothetical protein
MLSHFVGTLMLLKKRPEVVAAVLLLKTKLNKVSVPGPRKRQRAFDLGDRRHLELEQY